MTIAEHLQAKAVAFVWPLVLLCALAISLKWLPIPTDSARVAIALAISVTLLLLFLALAVRFRCPRCSGPLSALVAHFGPLRKVGRNVQCCPFCAVRMDEQL